MVLTQHLDVNLYRTKFLLSIICAKEMLQSMIRVIEVREPVLILFDDVSIDIIRPTFQYVGMCITASFMFILRIFLNTFIWLTGSVAVAFLYYKSIGPLFSSSDNLLEPQSYDKAEEEGRVISSVISLSISSNPPILYELEKVTFTLSHIKVSWNSSDYILLLWNIQRNEFFFFFGCVTLIICEFLSLNLQIQNQIKRVKWFQLIFL